MRARTHRRGNFEGGGLMRALRSCGRCTTPNQREDVRGRSMPLSLEGLEPRLLFAVPSGFALSTYATGLTRPVSMTAAPDGRVFVCEQGGTLRVIAANGQLQSTPFATVPAKVDEEQGLLGVALAPDFATSGNVYVHWTTGNARSRITRF